MCTLTESGLTRFVRITAASGQILQVSELAVFTADGTNVARGKPCTATTPFQAETTCDKAFDGALRTETYPNMYASNVGGGFLRVDLGTSVQVVRVEYYNRGDGATERAVGSRVELMDASSVVLASQTITTSAAMTTLTFATIPTATTTAPQGMLALIILIRNSW